MKARYLAIGVAGAIAFAAVSAMADHNSKNGEGWANMPNDVHNTRIETRESGDDEAFRDFVRHGEGADSVNRFATDDASAPGAKAQNGNAEAAKAQTRQMSGTQTQTRLKDGTGTNAQVKDQARAKDQQRSRTDTPDGAVSRQRSSRSSARAPRSGGRGRR